jgi:hypothetical protein
LLERLLESWLDSASERSYQGPFCQMLAADGHRVVHSTRHHPIEFGKDVITVAADGVPCAYQLKGNPGSRLTLSQFREIQKQLWQLATQAIVFPGVPSQMHRSYLVTNGYVEEDVQKSIAEMNTQFALGPKPHPTIALITRGDLLEMGSRLGIALWPSEVEDLNTLIQLLAHDGHDLFPAESLHKLLVRGLRLEPDQRADSQEDVRRRITSSVILVALVLTRFSRQNNHLAVVAAWTQFASYVIATCARHELDYASIGAPAVNIATGTVVDALCSLCDEASERKYLIEGDAFADSFAYAWRRQLLRGLMSLLWFWIRKNDDSDSKRRLVWLEQFLADMPEPIQIWGEGIIPQLLIEIWRERVANEGKALKRTVELLAFLCRANLAVGGEVPLPNPYYSFEEVSRHNARDFLQPKDDPLEHESFKDTSFYALPLLQLLAMRGLKGICQAAWPDMTRLNHKKFIPEHPWEYSLWHAESGLEQTVQLPKTQQWATLEAESQATDCPEVPPALLSQPFLLMLLVILFPYRGTPNVVRHLSRSIAS